MGESTKVCSKCLQEFDHDCFSIRSDTGRLRSRCKKCIVVASSTWEKENRGVRNQRVTNYRRTLSGWLSNTYTHMQQRVRGNRKRTEVRGFDEYFGLPLVGRAEFYLWARGRVFEMYQVWKRSGYRLTSRPTVDRIDPKLGYVLINMRFLTFSENSRLGALSRWAK